MKIRAQFAIAVLLTGLFASNSIYAQQDSMKKLPDVTVTANTNVSKKVQDYFNAHFKDAENPKWFKLNQNYLVEFITADLNNHVLFHKNGSIIYHIKYGAEQNLPTNQKFS